MAEATVVLSACAEVGMKDATVKGDALFRGVQNIDLGGIIGTGPVDHGALLRELVDWKDKNPFELTKNWLHHPLDYKADTSLLKDPGIAGTTHRGMEWPMSYDTRVGDVLSRNVPVSYTDLFPPPTPGAKTPTPSSELPAWLDKLLAPDIAFSADYKSQK